MTGTKFEEPDEKKNPQRRGGHQVKGMKDVDPETAKRMEAVRDHQSNCPRLPWADEIRTMAAQPRGFGLVEAAAHLPARKLGELPKPTDEIEEGVRHSDELRELDPPDAASYLPRRGAPHARSRPQTSPERSQSVPGRILSSTDAPALANSIWHSPAPLVVELCSTPRERTLIYQPFLLTDGREFLDATFWIRGWT